MSRITLATLAVFASAALVAGSAPAATRVTAGQAHLISHSKEAVPFLSDDYAHALAVAKARQVPIFVEAWAPW